MGGRDRDEGGREDGRVVPARLVQVEDPDQARHEGWQEGGLRQGGDGEGRAEGRQGFPGCRPEEEHLSRGPVMLTCSLLWGSCSSKPRLHCFSWALCGGGKQRWVACARPLWMAPLAQAFGVTVYVRGML